MTYPFYSSRIAWPSFVLLGFAATAVYAQTIASPAPAPSASAAVASPALPSFTSVLDAYRPYSDEKTANWKQSNDTTARIGGWRAYAKEARQLPAEAESAEAAAAAESRATPGAGQTKP